MATRGRNKKSELTLTDEQKKAFEREYKLRSEAQKTCGEIILGIMKKLGYDDISAEEYTGLNATIFHNLSDPDCVIPKRFIVSIGVGFGLDVHLTEYIMEANGLRFNTNNRVDKAYIHLLENYRYVDTGKDARERDYIADCNAVLRDLDIDKKHFLGSHKRGAYKPRKKKETESCFPIL